MEHTDILIIGGGAAGMACALKAVSYGKKVLLAERKERPGGVLLQCVHRGFGLGYFKEDLTGIEYADRFTKLLKTARKEGDLEILCDTTVLRVDPDRTALLSSARGLKRVAFEKVVFATGCRERSVYSLPVAGIRPAGVLTSGTAQKLINVDHLEISGRIVILGTGDIGQIVARQLIQAGKDVVCMIEQNDRAGGRAKNRKDCLEAFQIPLLLHSTISEICGEKRLESVRVRDLKTGKEQSVSCDVLLTAIGLIPETELIDSLLKRMPSEKEGLPPWVYKTGNCDYVHDIVDSVSFEAECLDLFQ